MQTLPRNGGAKHGAGAQVSGRSGALAVLLLCAASFLAASAYAADPQPYKVDLASTGDSDLNATLKATSDLIGLRTTAPVGPFGLIGRARSDLDRLKTVLESFGYYQSYVDITIDELPLDDPTLGERLTSQAKGDDARVKITFSLGPIYHLRKVEIDGDVPADTRGALGLNTGDLAIASEVLAGGERLQTALEDQGYAFAKVDPPIAHEIPAERVLDVSFHVVTGARVNIGAIRFRGLKRMHESFVRRRLLVHTGEQFGASKIERARKDLLALGVFSSVTVQVAEKADETGDVPITFRVRERPLHAVSLNAAYSSDLGGSTGVTWTDRNMSGKADQLTLAASGINLGGGSATTSIGYDLSAKYLLPEFGHRDQALQLAVGALNQSLQAYDQKALTFGAILTRKLSSIWTASVGLTAERERIRQEGFYTAGCPATGCIEPDHPEQRIGEPTCTATGCSQEIFTPARMPTNYTLLALPITLLYNTTGLESPIEDATHGIRASFSETPTLSLGAQSAKFFITQGSVAYYFDLQNLGLSPDPGRKVIALRALAGLAQGAGQYSLPPDQRFYAGGSGTIRGYRYQSVGPLFPDYNPIGGTAINAGTVEYRQRVGRNLGFAVFVDAGQVSRNVNPLDATLRFGAGAGVRYYTPIGPIRLDLAGPIQRLPGGDAFEIYIGLGQAF
ncbi:MAG TPA: BamA/TamA family outer membrane protein [Steroidobacteraceae bacterium]|nr:BamA/TamA family outer membrane protein [Steroidobacteraceae bacterium]